MSRSTHVSSVFLGVITARSSEVPTDAASLFYSVQVLDDTGVVNYNGVAPQANARWSSVADVDLVPFFIGQRVLIGVMRLGANEQIDILTDEKPDMGPCP